jgi:DnaJ-class molecular chaperone
MTCPICKTTICTCTEKPPPRRPYKCPVCDGTGKVWQRSDSTGINKQPCHACKGTGIVWG